MHDPMRLIINILCYKKKILSTAIIALKDNCIRATMSRYIGKKIGGMRNVLFRRYVAVGESISDSSSAVSDFLWV